MSVKLLRASSDTPNITNREDSRMTRFAYGGMDGVVQGFGNELSYRISGSTFGLNTGCIVLQGWEVDINGSGWEMDLSTVVGTQYHLVYLEVNLAIESAVIKSTYLTGTVPTISPGDDLTKYPNGTARLPLYSFVISNGVISSVVKKFSLLPYYDERFDALELWKSDILENHILQVEDLSSEFSSTVPRYGVKNVNLTPGKTYIFTCIEGQPSAFEGFTVLMYYPEYLSQVHSTLSYAQKGYSYFMRLTYTPSSKRLLVYNYREDNYEKWEYGFEGIEKIYYREL